ncbi:FCD domain-containing protein [Mesorhizobium australicum]|uniref:Pyruvate dehydrogenase complex repressor n=1 Tax=Mesorhizobium australicum TaxID=536018 RepID=A0A1X7NQD5_9HYPH|nr:FCD domain-containing protein [Mesorhizobium australicum]SMH39819.1 transcriptional regulator, GntR family [Mesorhizobium australicum]
MNDVFSRIEHLRTADEVVQQIESLILEGVLRVGDRLPGERDLAGRFEVSRPILRIALKSLEERGLITSRPGGGTYIADIVGQVFTAPMIELIAAHRKATADYLEYRRDIEGMAADYAARRATAEDRSMLDDIMTRMEAANAGDDFSADAEIDVEFHNAIGECAHNIILLHTLRSCYRLLADGVFFNRSLIYTLPGMREKLLAQHKAIHSAVVSGDPAAARRAAEAHIDFVAEAVDAAERTGEWQRVSRLRLLQRAAGERARSADRRS